MEGTREAYLIRRWWLVFVVGILVLVTLTAILGKVGGTVLVTRFQGMDMRSSLSLGVLMSTKGLVELIVLNIGLSKGVSTSA